MMGTFFTLVRERGRDTAGPTEWLSVEERRRGWGWLEIFAHWGVVPFTDGTRLALVPRSQLPDQHLPMVVRDAGLIVRYIQRRAAETRLEWDYMAGRPGADPEEVARLGADVALFCSMVPRP